MKQITASKFLAGVEDGSITEVFSIVKRIYGKTRDNMANTGKRFEVVWADSP